MKISKKPCSIYALCEPDGNLTVRYVGKTEMGLAERYKHHITPSELRANTHKNNWIKSLLTSGCQPVMIELEALPSGADWEARERYWIAYYRELGYSLANATAGGEGMCNPSDETRAKMSEAQRGNTKTLGIKQSEESNRKRSKAMKGRKPAQSTIDASQTPEAIAKRAETQRGRKRSPETCAKISASKRGKQTRLGHSPSAETREKLRQANLGKTLSGETRAKMSESRKGRKPHENNYKAVNSPESIAKRSETRRRKTQLKRLAILIASLASLREAV